MGDADIAIFSDVDLNGFLEVSHMPVADACIVGILGAETGKSPIAPTARGGA